MMPGTNRGALRAACLLAVCLLTAGFSRACQCAYYWADLTTALRARLAALPEKTAVVKASSVDFVFGYGQRFKVIQQYYGTPMKDPFIVWGDQGSLCRLTLTPPTYSLGDTFLLVLRNAVRQGPQEDTLDYELSPCGCFFLRVKGDSVFGGAPGSYAFNGFPLAAVEDSLHAVIKPLAVSEAVPAAPAAGLELYPNPASETVTIAWWQPRPGPAVLDVFDATGRRVYQRRLQAAGPGLQRISWTASGFPPGVYSVCVGSDGGQARGRLVWAAP